MITTEFEIPRPRRFAVSLSAVALRLPLLDVLHAQAVHVENLGWPGVEYCIVNRALALPRST